jgi:hypothetical protein
LEGRLSNFNNGLLAQLGAAGSQLEAQVIGYCEAAKA